MHVLSWNALHTDMVFMLLMFILKEEEIEGRQEVGGTAESCGEEGCRQGRRSGG